MPRLVPHVPGPSRALRLAALGLSSTSAPTLGSPKAAGLKNRSPVTPWRGLPTRTARYEVPPNPPTASVNSEPVLPGKTTEQLSQVQYGVKPVPLLMNIFAERRYPPTT